MKKVYQTRFGGIKDPVEEQGNCFQAAVASIFEIPLEEAFDNIPFETKEAVGKPVDEAPFFIEFNKWLSKYGVQTIFVQAFPQPRMTKIVGYNLLEVESTFLKNGETHIVVSHDGEVVHDPNSKAKGIGKTVGIFLFVPINLARVEQ